MGAISALEKTLENRMEALWARVFDKDPVELLDALRTECDSKAVVSPAGRVLAPNAYDVALAGSVHDELARHGGRVGQVLTDSLARHAERRGYEWAARSPCTSPGRTTCRAGATGWRAVCCRT